MVKSTKKPKLLGAWFWAIFCGAAQSDIGFMDNGWKDTILIAGGETVRMIKRFDDYNGYFPFHCHNLEHGSMGMMRDFKVI